MPCQNRSQKGHWDAHRRNWNLLQFSPLGNLLRKNHKHSIHELSNRSRLTFQNHVWAHSCWKGCELYHWCDLHAGHSQKIVKSGRPVQKFSHCGASHLDVQRHPNRVHVPCQLPAHHDDQIMQSHQHNLGRRSLLEGQEQVSQARTQKNHCCGFCQWGNHYVSSFWSCCQSWFWTGHLTYWTGTFVP